jgi:hypothetical protein
MVGWIDKQLACILTEHLSTHLVHLPEHNSRFYCCYARTLCACPSTSGHPYCPYHVTHTCRLTPYLSSLSTSQLKLLTIYHNRRLGNNNSSGNNWAAGNSKAADGSTTKELWQQGGVSHLQAALPIPQQ